MSERHHFTILVALAALGACKAARTDDTVARADTSVSQTPGIVRLSAPDDSLIPDGPLGVSIRRGRALLAATADSLPNNVGVRFRCTSCHLDDGTRVNASPLIGVYARHPQYRDRSGSVALIEDRVNECFKRSMNGRALVYDSPEMRDIVAWLAFLSRGTLVHRDTTPRGIPLLAMMPADTMRGRTQFTTSCAACHGMDGQGSPAGPPLWGPRSYNIGASMARIRTAASFIKYNMPADRPGTLTDQQAFDLAAYINSQARSDFPGKEKDWPKGNAPVDVPYELLSKTKVK